MVDPITITSVVAAVSQVAGQVVQAASSLVELYSKFKKAPELIEAQHFHIVQLTGITKLIIENPALQTAAVESILRTCLQSITKVNEELHRGRPLNGDTKGEKYLKTLKSLFKGEIIRENFDRLEREKVSLLLCIGEHDSRLLLSNNIQLNTMTVTVQDTAKDVKTVVNKIPSISSCMTKLQSSISATDEKMTTFAGNLPTISDMLTSMHDIMVELHQVSNPKACQIAQQQTYFEVPNRRVPAFFGREGVLMRVDQALCCESRRGPRVVVVRGMGGQGKTQIALEYCHRKKSGTFSAIFWVDATSEKALKASFTTISDTIHCSGDKQADDTARIAQVLRKLGSWPSRWLMVFDNYDELDLFPNIQDYFPQNDRGALIVTSRRASAAELVAKHERDDIEVYGLEESAAVDLLLHQSRSMTSNTVTDSAKKVVNRLGCHPLAIAQAGAYVRKQHIEITDFLQHYEYRRREILAKTPLLSQYRKRLGHSENEVALNVFTTWELSFQQLQGQTTEDGVETKLLTILAFFDPKDISESLFRDLSDWTLSDEAAELVDWLRYFQVDIEWSQDLFAEVSGVLADLSLVQSISKAEDGFYHLSLHPLVKDWIRLRTANRTSQISSCAVTLIVGHSLFQPNGDYNGPRSLADVQATLAHIICQEENYAQFIDQQCWLGPAKVQSSHDMTFARNVVAHFLVDEEQSLQAEKILQRSVTNATIDFGSDHPITLKNLHSLAQSKMFQGNYVSAAEELERLLERYKEIFSNGHPGIFEVLRSLSITLEAQGNYEAAEQRAREALAGFVDLLGRTPFQDTMQCLIILGRLLYEREKYEEAEELYLGALELDKEVIGNLYPDITSSFAKSLLRQGKVGEAEKMSRAALDWNEQFLGKTHLETFQSMNAHSTFCGV